MFEIRVGIKKYAFRLFPIAPGTADLLRITAKGQRETGMDDPRQFSHFPNKSLCVPVRDSVSTNTLSSMR